MSLKSKLHTLKEKYKGTKLETTFNALHTFLYMPNETTHHGTHIKAADDLKRTMNTVIMALIPCLIFGIFNVGYQHYVATGEFSHAVGLSFCDPTFWSWQNFSFGAVKVFPLVVVSYAVGLGIEFIFATLRGHEVEEGYLVTGMLVPLIVPVDLPLWMLAVAVAFGVIIGKEVFGGTGMNILNPALTIRAFLFFAYPTSMSGDKIWVEGATERAAQIAKGANLDAISGETILGHLAQQHDIAAKYSVSDMFFGFTPGSIGETSTVLIILAGLFLIFTKIGSWRVMLSMVLGGLAMGYIFNAFAPSMEGTKFFALWSLPAWQHLLIGGFAFGTVFMATDPVTAAQTNTGKYIYGFLAGFISIMIRCFNPAYPEGVMLAILLMNVFAPTIDHYVVQANVARRKKRLKAKTA
ncbi:NADH:ubiquinone reductase (Na(+)-transporting) subunit B [Capnocytophaga sp.]|uniref:NADH:ubiquinone reductase (Na(+)-transporting) subunit B n=1 Tax=Capnocytophaga sp. TaxID=44737 RepID=UPI0026DD9CC5|nr:NADH:ubiquinone reductase (Na(+)-transporting) subunit B [Capnocytophaga sp.]MDO5104769.1 NADH:ubiquinone reductase (Na(+)-transporting) subunit B [Capnocytophaga sp.]